MTSEQEYANDRIRDSYEERRLAERGREEEKEEPEDEWLY